MNTLRSLKFLLLLSLSSITSAFLHTVPYKLVKTPATNNNRVHQLQMCNINATDVFEKVRNLRGTRSDIIKIGTATSALFIYDTLFTKPSQAVNIPDDSWTQHNGAFTEDYIKDFKKTSSGLLYKDVVTGSGASPNDGDAVTLEMVGYIYETGEKWTNTYKGIPAYQSVIRAGPRPNQKFMKGLNEGVLDMKHGGKRILVIPAYLAYNYVTIYSQENPNTEIIPGGAALVCYIEVLSFKPLPK